MMRWRREERREKKRAVRLQPIRAQEPRKSVRVTDGLYINCKELTIIQVDWKKTIKVLTVSLLAVLLALLLASKSKCQEHWNVAPWSTEKHICQWGRWRVLFVPCFGEAVPWKPHAAIQVPVACGHMDGLLLPSQSHASLLSRIIRDLKGSPSVTGTHAASHGCPKFGCNLTGSVCQIAHFSWFWAPGNLGFVFKLPDPTFVNPCITCHLFQKAKITFFI